MPTFQVNKDNTIYYELNGSGERKMILLMGFSGTLRGFDEIVDILVKDGRYQVLTLDNRGCGKSISNRNERQTTQLLASDAWKLMNHVGWGKLPIHVYGCSMGGMIAQELMFPLLKSKRLASCYLEVTARKLYPFQLPIPKLMWKLMFTPLGMMNKEKLVDIMLPKVYSEEYINSIDKETGEKMEKKLRTELLNDWDKNIDFSTKNISDQSTACATHFLGKERIKILVASKVPITCQISLQDKSIPTKLQIELAELLHAKQVKLNGGHLAGKRFRDIVQNEINELHLRGIEYINNL